VISGSASKTDHPSGEDGYVVKECVFGGQFKYLVSDLTYGDSSTPDTVFSTEGIKTAPKATKAPPPPVLGPHEYVTNRCMICTSCAYCTGYYQGCCMCGSRDRTADKGKDCGCGHGKSGCKHCGMCDKCGGSGATCTGSPAPTPPEPGVLPMTSGWISASHNQSDVPKMLSPDPLTMWKANKVSSLTISVPSGSKSNLCTVEILLHSSCDQGGKVVVAARSAVSQSFIDVTTTTVKAKSTQWQTLVQPHHYARKKMTTTPDVIRLEFQSNMDIAGIRLRDVTVACSPLDAPLTVGDRVCLSDTCSGNITIISIGFSIYFVWVLL
jgi:hypothetical protein